MKGAIQSHQCLEKLPLTATWRWTEGAGVVREIRTAGRGAGTMSGLDQRPADPDGQELAGGASEVGRSRALGSSWLLFLQNFFFSFLLQ